MKKKKIAIVTFVIVITVLIFFAICFKLTTDSRNRNISVSNSNLNEPVVVAGGKPTLYVEEVTAGRDAKEASLNIYVANNPGVTSIAFIPKYDKENLKLIGFEINDIIGGESVPFNEEVEEVKIVWINGLENINGDFKLVSLTFDITNADYGLNSVGLTYEEDDIFDLNENNIEFLIMKGGIVCE